MIYHACPLGNMVHIWLLKLNIVIQHRPCHLHSSVMLLGPKSKCLWDILIFGRWSCLGVSGDTLKLLLVFLILLPSLLEAKNVAAQLLTSFLNFVRSIIAISKLSTLRLHFTQGRLGKPSSLFSVTGVSNKAFILAASLSWLAFFPKQCYPMVAISHRGSAKAAHQCHFH